MATIEYVSTIPDKAHVYRVGLRTVKTVPQEDAQGNVVRDAQGNIVMVQRDVIKETEVRTVKWDGLDTAAKRMTYATECAEYHHTTDMAKKAARRAAWDADDKAAQEAKFIMRHVSTTAEGVTVSVTWQGLTAQHVIPNDPATATANAQALHQAEKAKRDAEAAMVSAFNVG